MTTICVVINIVIAAVIVIAVVSCVIKGYSILRCKARLDYYGRQGLMTYWDMANGQASLFSPKLSDSQTTTTAELVKRLELKNIPAIAANQMDTEDPVIFLAGGDLIKEFLIVEDKFKKASLFDDENLNLSGLFLQNGQDVHTTRSLFTSFFSCDNMSKLTPRISHIIEESLDAFIKKHQINDHEYTKTNLNDLYEQSLDRIRNLIVFGDEDLQAESEEQQVIDMQSKIFSIFTKVKNYYLGKTIQQVAAKWNLFGPLKELKKLRKSQSTLVQQIIARRMNDTNIGKDCILDILISRNREVQSTGNVKDMMNYEDIAGHLNHFIFAVTRNPINAAKITICMISENSAIKSDLHDISKSIYSADGKCSYEKIDKSERLSLWIREALRIYNPVLKMSTRIATQDVKLGGFTIKKGDSVAIMPMALNFDPNHVVKPEVFDPSRFSMDGKKFTPRHQHIPFSVGKRNCLGKNLGELMVKLFVVRFCLTFVYAKPDDLNYQQIVKLTSKMLNPYVLVKLHSK